VVAERRHPDHHRFSSAELAEAFAEAARRGAGLVVTTEKDAVRLDPALATDPRLAVLTIAAEVTAGEGALDEALDAALKVRHASVRGAAT
jgi:tetraacyldisaccharide 4'-kinase